MKTIKEAIKPFLKKDIPDVQPGDTVRVFQKLKEKDKERIQVFEGVVIAKKHRREIGATITVRKTIGGIGVEKIYPLHLPTIEKIEIVRRSKVRRAKLYYLRTAKGKRARLKRKDFVQTTANKKSKENLASEIKGEINKEEAKEKVPLTEGGEKNN